MMNVSDQRQSTRGDDQANRCNNCRSYISHQFARVFGDNNNEVYRCPQCANFTSLRNGDGGMTD